MNEYYQAWRTFGMILATIIGSLIVAGLIAVIGQTLENWRFWRNK